MLALKSTSSTTSPQGCIDGSKSSESSQEQSSTQAPATLGKELEALTPPSREGFEIQSTENAIAVESREQKNNSTASPFSSGPTPKEAIFGPALFLKDLKDGTRHIVQGLESYLNDETISTTKKVLTVGGAIAALGVSAAHGASEGLGALGFVLCRLGATLQQNKHSRAQAVVQGGVLGAHFATDNNDALAATNGVYAGRMLAQSMIPESRTKLNIGVTTAGVALSCTMFCCSKNFSPAFAFENVPLVATVLGGIMSSLRSEFSGVSRVGWLAISSMMLPYHCFVSGSWFLAALSLVNGHATTKMLLKVDLPLLRKKNLSLRTLMKGWNASTASSENPSSTRGADKAAQSQG